jgi:hypothetical protein
MNLGANQYAIWGINATLAMTAAPPSKIMKG